MHRKNILYGFLGFCGYFLSTGASAQSSFHIPVDQQEIDGKALNIQPGDSILLEAGTRDKLKFTNLMGSAGQPIIIMPKDEKVIVDTKAHTGIAIENSAYVHLTGGDTTDQYGIEIAAAGSMGIYVTEYSTDCEIDDIEIHNIGFAGIMAKTDPDCGRKDMREFVMKNISFHDNYIYDTGGEGFYVGYSKYPSKVVDCNGAQTTIFPHAIHGVRIYNNIIKNTGWDGLQVGSATANVKIYGNSIENYGLKSQEWQNHAVQIGEGTTGDFYNNIIANGTGGGVSFFGSGNNRMYNNVIVNTGESAIYQNDKGSSPGRKYQIYNNTIIKPARAGIFIESTKTRGNLVANNIIVLEGALSGVLGANTAWIEEGNMIFGKIEEVGFEDPENNNFRLQEGARCIDNGYGISHLAFDHDFHARPANGQLDVGAFEYGSVPYVAPALGVGDEESEQISLFPNPTSQMVNIKLDGASFPDSIIIYDQIGKVVMNKPLELNRSQKVHALELGNDWVQGVYYVSLYEENRHLTTQKLIVK